MFGETEIHYTFNENEIKYLLKKKGYNYNDNFSYNNIIYAIIEIFINEYTFLECEYHSLIDNEREDIPNTEIEYIIFNILALYTEVFIHNLKADEIISDFIRISNNVIKVYIHDLESDMKKSYCFKLNR